MTANHADSHDFDKLARWHSALATEDTYRFPVHAVFLVSVMDTAAHDIFRQFRSSFEARGARFHHLVIFGQHGVSRTSAKLLAEFGLQLASIPVVVLVSGPSFTIAYVVPLPSGDRPECGYWSDVLSELEGAADSNDLSLDLGLLQGVESRPLGGGSLVDAVGRVLSGLA